MYKHKCKVWAKQPVLNVKECGNYSHYDFNIPQRTLYFSYKDRPFNVVYGNPCLLYTYMEHINTPIVY